MSKRAKILATAAVVTIGTTMVGHAVQSKSKIQSNKSNINIKNVKLLADKETNNLSNKTIMTRSWTTGGGSECFTGAALTFNTTNMTLQFMKSQEIPWFQVNNDENYVTYELFNANLQSQGSIRENNNGNISTVGGSWNNKTFKYGDILYINTGEYSLPRLYNEYNQTFYINEGSPLSNGYYKITPQGLIVMNGLYKIPNGSVYYFENGKMLTNIWVNVNSEGNRVYTTPNGTTINAYYLGANGVAEKGLQRISGQLQYLNPTTGIMELNKFITVDGKTYYLQPINGVAATGWQTIDGNKYYFNNDGVMQTGLQTIDGNKYYFNNNGVMQTGLQTIDGNKYYFNNDGVMQTGLQTIDGSVYDFDNNGKLIGKVTIAIEGATNETISANSEFDPLKGVTLNDKADPTAKINVSGTVNTKVPGVYTLTYTVTDSYGQTATVTRKITVTSSSSSNTEDLYWNQGALIINGNVEGNDIPKSLNKKLVIMNADNNVVDSINTTSVNWYSNNKNNYSGFQGIITPNILSTLKSNEIYKFYIEINGQYIPLISNITSPYNKDYLLSGNSNNQLTINKIDSAVKPINTGTASYEVGYFTSDGYVINGDISLTNNIFNKATTKLLLVKDTQGNVVDTINTASINWYSINKNNYSGFQGIIPYSVLDKLGVGEGYTLSLETFVDGKVYETPINNTKGFILNDSIEYNVSTNSSNNITITKVQTYPLVNSGTGIFKGGYWMPYGYVMNIQANIGEKIPSGTKMQLISKNLEGQVVSVTTGTDVNWYSNDKSDYNGLQAIITPKQLVMASTSNKLYIRVNIGGKTYESPVTGNLDIYGTGVLNYGFKTIDNQINLIIK